MPPRLKDRIFPFHEEADRQIRLVVSRDPHPRGHEPPAGLRSREQIPHHEDPGPEPDDPNAISITVSGDS